MKSLVNELWNKRPSSVLFVVCFFLLSGCYLQEQAIGQLKIRFSQVPIKQILAEETYLEHQELLRQVELIRQFSFVVLRLKKSENYTDYYHTEEKGITYTITASPTFELRPYTWWFPIIGSVPYKGFFNREDSLIEQKKLEDTGHEVWSFAVPAYSTLGWFRDPITTPMLKNGLYALTNTIIHELTHVTLYENGAGNFNEQLASFVAQKGTKQFLESNAKHGKSILERREMNKEKHQKFRVLMNETYKKTESLYQSGISIEEKTRRKIKLFKKTSHAIQELYPRSSKRFQTINNARLLQFRRYSEQEPIFQDLWEKSGKNWENFWQQLREQKEALIAKT